MNRFTRHRPLFSKPLPKHVREPRIAWRVGGIVLAGLKRTCLVLGAFMLFSIVMGAISALTIEEKTAPPIPKNAVLYLELEDSIPETSGGTGFAGAFAPPQDTLSQITKAIDLAADDKRIKGIYMRLYDGEFPLSQVHEIRSALARFKATGKFTRIYSSSYGGVGSGGMGRFYLASLFDERWMQPMGVVSIAGIRAEVPFLGELLAKIGISPQFFQKKEYKTAYESITRKEISPENKRMLEDIVGGMKAVLMRDVPRDLNMEPAQFEKLVNKGLFTAEEALASGLITRIDYADTMIEKISEDVAEDPNYEGDLFVTTKNYLTHADKEKGKAEVALVYAVGAIMEDADSSAPLGADGVAAGDEIAEALFDAAEDDKIEAVILRIDSPGGSPVASESILRGVEKVKAEGKPVIVSMGSMAASGGYWIATYADRIFALPTTLTGSIGVVGGKIALGDMWDKIGVNWNDEVRWGKNSGLWSFNEKFSESEAAQMDAMLEDVYQKFLARVAKGRGMQESAVDKIARGRVWTGSQGVQNGLVDEIGGLDEALNYTAIRLNLKDKSDLKTVILPRPKSWTEELQSLLVNSGAVYEGLKLQARLADIFQKPFAGIMAYEPVRVK